METQKNCSLANATILASQKIAQSFYENIFELSRIRTDWTPEYAQQLEARIKTAKEKYLPLETSCKHPKKRPCIHDLMISSVINISVLRELIKVEFRDDPAFQKRVFQELGFNDLYSEAKNGDYRSLYYLTKSFYENMTPAMREKLVSRTIPAPLIDRVNTYYQEMKDYVSCFDLINGSMNLSDEGKRVFNEIFSEIKDICRVVSTYYMLDPVLRDQFSFFRVMHNLDHFVPEAIYDKV
ncbi:MAG: hypothetical protein PHI28_07335 [Mangrovibacterium sp.]|nr:hypothetical protein [Mangrovibacterium sp.]